MKLTSDSKKEFGKYLVAIHKYRNTAIDFSSYMRKMDELYMRESAILAGSSKDTVKAASRDIDGTFIAPVILPQLESARAYLTNLFLAQDPIFQAAGNKDNIDAATQFNLLLKRDADTEGWRSELSKGIIGGLKYNLMCEEVSYVTRKTFSVDPQKIGATREVLRQSNSVRNINLYNAVWDQTVSPSKIHSEGAFAGYVEFMSRIKLIKWFQELPAAGVQCSQEQMLAASKWLFQAEEPIIKSCTWNAKYIDDFRGNGGTISDFTGFWDNGAPAASYPTRYMSANTAELQFRGYQKFVLYVRILPQDFKVSVPSAKDPQIWKLIWVNNELVFAEQQTNAHQHFPMLFSEVLSDGLDYQTLSYAENLRDVQAIISKLWTAELKSTNRVIGDRAVYNPLSINGNHLKSKSGASKIPLTGAAASIGSDPRLAYYQIPYQDPALGLRMSQASQMFAMADKISGQNPTLQGNFVKGNKTDNQFQETVQGTEARLLLMAIMLETNLFTPMKEIIKTNVFQYKIDELVTDSVTKQPLQIDAQKLRQSQIDFELGDGLAAASAKAMLPVIGQSLQMMQVNPLLGQSYDIVGMVSYFLKLSGFRRIKDFEYTPEQKAQNAALLAQQAAAGSQSTAPNAQAAQTPTQ